MSPIMTKLKQEHLPLLARAFTFSPRRVAEKVNVDSSAVFILGFSALLPKMDHQKKGCSQHTRQEIYVSDSWAFHKDGFVSHYQNYAQ